ncbi:MAG: ankyrin repeat domain-containing protein [Bacteroidota bacterium]
MSDDFGYTPLIRAAWQGDLTQIDYWIRKGAYINQADHAGMTVVMHAASQCQEDAFRMLVQHGADLRGKDVAQRSVLHHAARGNCSSILRFLVRHGNVLDGADKSEQTPLMWAVMNRHSESVRLLLDLGAQPDLKDHQGRTALYIAVQQLDHQEESDLSSERGSDKRIAGESSEGDKPPFFQRIKKGFSKSMHKSWSWMKRTSGSIWEGIKTGGEKTWTYITRPPWKKKSTVQKPEDAPPVIAGGNFSDAEQIIKLLMDAGASPDAQTQNGSTPRMLLEQKNQAHLLVR